MSFILNLLGPDGPQTKKAAFLLVILCSCAWLSWELWRGMSAMWFSVYGALLAAVTGGYLGGKRIEQATNPANPNDPPTSPEGTL